MTMSQDHIYITKQNYLFKLTIYTKWTINKAKKNRDIDIDIGMDEMHGWFELILVVCLVVEDGRDYVLKEAIFRRKILVVKKRVVNVVGRVNGGGSGGGGNGGGGGGNGVC